MSFYDFFLILEIDGCISFWFISFVWEVWLNQNGGSEWLRYLSSLTLVYIVPRYEPYIEIWWLQICLQTFDGQFSWMRLQAYYIVQ